VLCLEAIQVERFPVERVRLKIITFEIMRLLMVMETKTG
jgi:hypothetical protein